MTRHEYDEEASKRLHMDVVYEVDDTPFSMSRWISAMQRMNSIKDPLARRLISLHRECGSLDGVCDSADEVMTTRRINDWGCETMSLIAHHFEVEYPSGTGD